MTTTNAARALPRPAKGVRRATAISLFAGAGGLDLGCEQAGFQTRAVVELQPVAQQTLLANAERWLPGLVPGALFSDIVELDYEALLDAAGLEVGEVDLLHGGPPCTPFSKSGYWLAYKRAGEDPKASLLDNYVEALRAIRPKAFLMENVFGLAYQNHNRAILKRFIKSVRDAGYSFDSRIVLAADHGVPQLRQRLFCAGIRRDLLDMSSEVWRLDWPSDTHAGPHERRVDWDDGLLPHVTASEAFAGLTIKQNPQEPEEARERHLRVGASPGSAGGQLPVLYRQARVCQAPVSLAQPLLELPAQAAPRPALADDPRPTGTLGWTLPLGGPAAARRRAQAPDDLPGRLCRVWQPASATAAARKRGASAAGTTSRRASGRRSSSDSMRRSRCCSRRRPSQLS